MICPFCSQWNPDGAPRCCFCDNEPQQQTDGTLSGQPAYLRNTTQGVQLPQALPSVYDQPKHEPGLLDGLMQGRLQLRLQLNHPLVMIGGALLLGLLVLLWFSC